MIIYLKTSKEYENRYDEQTIRLGLEEARFIANARDKFYEKATDISDEDIDKMDFWWSRLASIVVDQPMLERYDERQQTIEKWTNEDASRDKKLSDARPIKEHSCPVCNCTGMKLVTKILSPKPDALDYFDQDVLFMFKCLKCNKNCSYWEDGEPYASETRQCPKDDCDGNLETSESKTGKNVYIMDTCNKCSFTQKEKINVDEVKKPTVEELKYATELKKLFCIDAERASQIRADKQRLSWAMAEIDKLKEKEEHKEVYDDIAKIQMLKIADFQKLLQPKIEKAGYIEVRFEKPELWPSVSVEFSCLDAKTEREDYKSSKDLKAVILKSLKGTNWRLMSGGIDYRLGYLSGRVRAYEKEEDLFKLIKNTK